MKSILKPIDPIIHLLCLIVFFSQISFAQAPNTLWTKTYEEITGSSLIETYDFGYLVVGTIDHTNSSDLVILKTNSLGDSLWTKRFRYDIFNSGITIKQMPDSGFIILGETRGTIWGDRNIWLLRTNMYGDTLWTKKIFQHYGNDMQITNDNGFVIVGTTFNSDKIWLIKTDEYGDMLWTKGYAAVPTCWGNSVQQASDSGYIITGFTDFDHSASMDGYLIKTDNNGDSLWAKTFNYSILQSGSCVRETIDLGYIITGPAYFHFPDTGYSKLALIKTDYSGEISWTKTYEGITGSSIEPTIEGGFIIIGAKSYSARGWVIKIDAGGDTLWTKLIGRNDYDGFSSIQQTADEGYIILGTSYAEKDRILLVKLSPDLSNIDNDNPEATLSTFTLSQNYPNPFNPVTMISYQLSMTNAVELSIYNLLGQKVATLVNQKQPAGSYQVQWDASDFASGVYYYQLKAGDNVQTRKMVLIR